MKFNKVKWMWLPLAMGVLINYIFQRGLVIFSKTNMVSPELLAGLPWMYIFGGLAAAFVGLCCDNVNARKIFLLSTICGFIGLLTIGFSPILFGFLFGASVAAAKLCPFTGTMKLVDHNPSMNIYPQSIAKSLASILIPFIFGGFLTALGFNYGMSLLATIYLLVGYWVYKQMPDDYIEGWNLKAIPSWLKNWNTWLYIAVFISTGITYQLVLREMLPTLMNFGYTKLAAIALASSVAWLEFGVRLPACWLGDKLGHKYVFICQLVGILALIFLPFFPILALVLNYAASGCGTPSMFPFGKQIAGKANVATFMGIMQVLNWIGCGIAFGFVK